MDEHPVDMPLDECGGLGPPLRRPGDQNIPYGNCDPGRAKRPRVVEQGFDFLPERASAERIMLQNDKLGPDLGEDRCKPVAPPAPVVFVRRVALFVDKAAEGFVG